MTVRGLAAAACVLALGLFPSGCAREPVERVEWTVMGTVAAVQMRGGSPDELKAVSARVRETFARVEKLLNAHDPGSELRRLAPLGEAEILAGCDPSVSNCYAAAFRLMRESGGAFNPRWRGTNTIDLGAIAKGFAVDVAAAELGEAAHDILLDLGGNLKSVRGAWRVGIAGTDRIVTLATGEACATSAEYFRGKHIYDGRTGSAVSNGLHSVTVVHPSSAMRADGLSTTLYILGRAEGERMLESEAPRPSAVWIDAAYGQSDK